MKDNRREFKKGSIVTVNLNTVIKDRTYIIKGVEKGFLYNGYGYCYILDRNIDVKENYSFFGNIIHPDAIELAQVEMRKRKIKKLKKL